MPKKPLLLSPAKQAVLVVQDPAWAVWLRYVAIAVGILMVVIGLADVCSRLARAAAGDNALFDAFAPAAAIKSSLAPVPVADASSTVPFVPSRLKVPSLGIDAKVEEVGKKADNSMGTPSDFLDAGWWGEGGKPGAPGNAVFDGHVNNALTKAGVFEHLSQIHKGDYVTVADAVGHTLVYKVSEVDLYDPGQAPLAHIFATSGPSQLVLITCDGEWVQDEHQFNKRLVVVAKPAY
jgi:LPXTG-site transpeptidase (sortase) family protein